MLPQRNLTQQTSEVFYCLYTVNVLRSEKCGRYYKGQTNDLDRRLRKHNNGEDQSTAPYVPWKLVFSVEVASRSAALILERKLKNMTSRKKMDVFLEKHGNKEEGGSGPDTTSLT
ncbi:MAG: GIY-YIG nuclease family protein [Ferruginibacter sp.]